MQVGVLIWELVLIRSWDKFYWFFVITWHSRSSKKYTKNWRNFQYFLIQSLRAFRRTLNCWFMDQQEHSEMHAVPSIHLSIHRSVDSCPVYIHTTMTWSALQTIFYWYAFIHAFMSTYPHACMHAHIHACMHSCMHAEVMHACVSRLHIQLPSAYPPPGLGM